DWQSPVEVDVSRHIKPGENPIEIEAEISNEGNSPAGFVATLALLGGRDVGNRYVITDDSWEIAPSRDAKTWGRAKAIANLGAAPWGDALAAAGATDGGERDAFNVPLGFQVEK